MQGQDVVYCAISGEALPQIAENIVAAMSACGVKRLIFMGAVGIYNEIPDEMDGEDNLDNEPAQMPNRQAVDIVEASGLNCTVLRPGYLKEGEEKRLCPVRKRRTGERVYYDHSVPCETGPTAYFGRRPVCKRKRQHHAGCSIGERGSMKTRRL